MRPRKLSAMSSTLHAAHLDPEAILLRAGAKQIIKKEGVPLADVDALVDQAGEWGLAVHVARDREYGLGARDSMDRAGRGYVTVLLARDATVLPRARALLDAESDLRAPTSTQRQAMRGFGELLGYPPCCIEAYLAGPSSPAFERGTTGFYLEPYHRTAGPFDPRLNRFALDRALVSHAPCTYRCAPSAEIAQAALDATEVLDPGFARRSAVRLARPVLWWSQERQVILTGAHWERGWLNYSGIEASSGADPSAPSVREAFERAAAILEQGTALRYVLGARVDVRSRDGSCAEIGDLAPLDPPFLFDFGGGWWPYERPARIDLVVEPGCSPLLQSRIATLAGDLLRVGVPTRVVQSAPASAGVAPESAERLDAATLVAHRDRRATLHASFAALRQALPRAEDPLPAPCSTRLYADLSDAAAPFAPLLSSAGGDDHGPSAWHLETELAAPPSRVARDLAGHIAYVRSHDQSLAAFVIDEHTSPAPVPTWLPDLAQELSRRGASRIRLILDLPDDAHETATAALRPVRSLLARRRIQVERAR